MGRLLSARNYEKDATNLDLHEWDNIKLKKGIRVSPDIFDEAGNLKIFKPEEWNDKFVSTYPYATEEEDDIPF